MAISHQPVKQSTATVPLEPAVLEEDTAEDFRGKQSVEFQNNEDHNFYI